MRTALVGVLYDILRGHINSRILLQEIKFRIPRTKHNYDPATKENHAAVVAKEMLCYIKG